MTRAVSNLSHIPRVAAPTSEAPLYKEVRRSLLQCLAKGEWKPGERLPAEPELAARFGVAIPTVRAGVADLVDAGVLIRRQGKGTFVARHDSTAQEFRFSNILNSRNENISTRRTNVTMRKTRADADTARLFGSELGHASLVYRIDAVLEAETTRAGLMNLILPLPRFLKLGKADLEQSADNLYSVYQRVCGVTVLRMEERVYSRIADKDLAKTLQVKLGHPIMVVDRLAYTFDDRPVEIRRRYFEGLEHQYFFTHNRLD
jgi:GntR family transcriptional regulator